VIRAVVDTSVLVSAFIGRPEAAPSQLVAAWRDRRFTLIASPQLLAELDEVLARPKFARWSDEGRGQAYAAAFAARAELHLDPPAAAATRDPGDDYIVALARATAADMIVSVDRDLLEAEAPDLVFCTPADLLAAIKRADSA
jgi:putative PIN family toxin of toxin-antitoxin system